MRAGWILVVIGLAASAQGDELREARDHYRRALKSYEVGQYDEAIQEFAAAYKLKDDPSILFNLAQSHRLAGHRTEALRTYRMFLVKVPNAANRQEVEAMISNLQHDQGANPDRDLAQRYLDSGAVNLAAGRYQAALTDFQKARLVKPSPVLDLEIAQAYDKLGRLEEALASYRIYVESRPEPKDATEVRARLQVLEERLAASAPHPPPEAEPAPVAAPPPAAPHVDTGRPKTVAGIAMVAVGAAALAGGIACGVLSQGNSDDLTHLDQTRGSFSASKDAAGRAEQIGEGVLLGIGGAAAVTGVVLIVLGRRVDRLGPVSFLPMLAPGLAGAAVARSF